MPGSTTSSSEDTSKAKVTDSTAANGIFVRPVAVAGIFRPADESKPPALPEKRRFSALVGDFRPCSSGVGNSTEDFARRRQSWDNRQKDVPFGQALLKKTPRNTPQAPRLVKSEVLENGTSSGNGWPDNENCTSASAQGAGEKPSIPASAVKSETSKTGDNIASEKAQPSVKDRFVNNVSTNEKKRNDNSKVSEVSGSRVSINHSQQLTNTVVKDKTEAVIKTSSIFISSVSSTNEKSETNKNVNSEIDTNKSSSTTEVKQTKKVYGLGKRDSKTEVSTCNAIQNAGEKICAATSNINVDITQNKPKVYGLSKASVRKEIEKDLKGSEENLVQKQPDNQNILPNDGSLSGNTKSKANIALSKAEQVEKVIEFQKASSPPKDFRVTRRTSDVIAAKMNIFANIAEKPLPVFTRKSKPAEKETATTKTTTENITKDNVISTQSSKHATQTSENVSKDNITITQPSKFATQSTVTKENVESKKFLAAEGKSSYVVEKSVAKDAEKNVDVEKQKVQQGNKPSDSGSSSADLNQKAKLNIQKNAEPEAASRKSESNDALQSCKTRDTVSSQGVKTEPPLKKADSKTEHSINMTPSKALDKKIPNIEGKMPIKKVDQKSSDGTLSSSKPTNQKNDRKSSDSAVPPSTTVEVNNKEAVSKGETGVTSNGESGLDVAKKPKAVFVSNAVVNVNNIESSAGKVSEKSIKLDCKLSEKDSVVSKSNIITQATIVNSSVTEIVSTSTNSALSVESDSCKVQKSSETVEIAKITPSAVPGIVPTVNVLFRTKSPQGSSNKEENRKKVVVETSTCNVVPSSVISSPNISGKPTSEGKASFDAAESVKEALKTIEVVQKSLTASPKISSKRAIVNLQKQELASVTLSSNDQETAHSNSKVALESDQKVIDQLKDSHQESKVLPCLDKPISVDIETPAKPPASPSLDISNFQSIDPDNSSADSNLSETAKFSSSESRMTVVDLGEWNKKFQRLDAEAPRAPLRRRALRDSMPPALPLRSPSRFGSLKRIDDSPRYVARSPSQSSLPQRYSYTEMLSKVCSMGVLPYADPFISKSCSSSSSQVSELWSELSEEQSTATHASEMLEAETTERMRLEKEVQDLQSRCSQVQQRSDQMEMEMIEARVYRTPELNGDLSEDDDPEGNSSIYRQKYERAVRDMEIMKRRIQQQHEEEIEQKVMMKKASDKRLAEALEDVEEERQVANQWKRKAQKLGSELQDLRLLLEEQMARNGELEKKQRRFDAELSAAQEEIKKERLLREKLMREKDQALHEKYSLEQDLQASKLDADMLHEKITQLNRELDELTLSSKGEEEVTQLKRAKQELERKTRDQEEELEELAAQLQMLEQAKLRLEMSLEKVRQEHRREASVREEEIEEIRASFSKKTKNLEAQLEAEQDERHQLMKQKHELERRLYEIADQPPPQDPEIERRLRRDLKRTKALLRDAQSMLEHTREGQSSKTLIRQLKNQLEDSEFAKAAAVKARQAVEAELHDCQLQLEEITRTKNEAESRCLQLSREKSAIQTQLEEAEEEMAEVMKKYKAVVAQMSIDQKTLAEQNQQIAELETERQMLKDQLNEVSHKFEHLAGQSEDTHKVHRLDSKVRDLESKLELEQTTRARLEHQIARLKEQNDRTREECDSLRNKELQAQEGVRRLQRQIRDLREDYSALQQKEADAYRKQHELEMALENTETDLQVTKNDLRLACQRIQDLQNALEDDLDSGTDVPDDSGSDSDSNYELAMMRTRSVTPIQRCDSVASNLSYDTDGHRSRTSSFSHELSAFSRMMLRKTSMDFLG